MHLQKVKSMLENKSTRPLADLETLLEPDRFHVFFGAKSGVGFLLFLSSHYVCRRLNFPPSRCGSLCVRTVLLMRHGSTLSGCTILRTQRGAPEGPFPFVDACDHQSLTSCTLWEEQKLLF